ncbi:hypothetical protein BGX27_008147 [Mortierella sp. AM989]|nr:hypothetical protein BGX27_008147 [Mortierella sp. AM989]
MNRNQGLAVAQKDFGFFKQASSDVVKAASETLEKQHVLENLKALSSPSDQKIDADDREGVEDLLKAEMANSPSAPSPSSSKGADEKAGVKDNKKSSGHEDDIIHEYDHADNDAYDDIVWYDGPHRDDEDEHEHEDEHDDHHHDEDVEENTSDEKTDHAQQSNPSAQLDLQDSHQHEHSDNDNGGSKNSFQHSGADILIGVISTQEFCLRLKHECESTCREFKSGVEHLSITCETGSVAELLFWGKCCQIGHDHRIRTISIKLDDELANQHVRWQ